MEAVQTAARGNNYITLDTAEPLLFTKTISQKLDVTGKNVVYCRRRLSMERRALAAGYNLLAYTKYPSCVLLTGLPDDALPESF
jgi:hypothetical protein